MGTIGGPFTLTASTGKPFSSAELNGKPAAIFFGFTHCPDVCPTTLARLTKLRRELGKGDDALSIVFISVDPERDTPAEVDSYMKLYDTPVIGLTGTPAQIEQVKKQFGIYSRKVDQPGGGYSVDHTATRHPAGPQRPVHRDPVARRRQRRSRSTSYAGLPT